jgi:hypothetical protein
VGSSPASAPLAPLTPEEEARFAAVARWPGDLGALAARLTIPHAALHQWVSTPRIQSLLAQHRALVARIEANKDRQAKTMSQPVPRA